MRFVISRKGSDGFALRVEPGVLLKYYRKFVIKGEKDRFSSFLEVRKGCYLMLFLRVCKGCYLK